MNDIDIKMCPICRDNRVRVFPDTEDNSRLFYDCCVCGRFVMPEDLDICDLYSGYDVNQVASFLFYNNDKAINDLEVTKAKYYSFDGMCFNSQDYLDSLDQSNIPYFTKEDITPITVSNWLPRSFKSKIDCILLYLETHTDKFGDLCVLDYNETISLLFAKRYELIHGCYYEPCFNDDMMSQISFICNWLFEESYVLTEKTQDHLNNPYWKFRLQPQGYSRIDAYKTDNKNTKDVLVAMQFGETTIDIRNAIRKGIEQAGYNPIFIDEVEHNNQIIPELLYTIRNSRFIVVDLTHNNRGAYFEEGYALGCGKNVIQLCKAGTELHFDTAQKNTIIWETEEDIPEKLYKRIQATID